MPKPPIVWIEGVDLNCPVTGLVIGGMIIRPHKLRLRFCRGGESVYGECKLHAIRVFVNEPDIVRSMRNVSTGTAIPRGG